MAIPCTLIRKPGVERATLRASPPSFCHHRTVLTLTPSWPVSCLLPAVTYAPLAAPELLADGADRRRHEICTYTSRVAATIRRHIQGGDMATEPTDQVGTRLMFENDRVRVWDLALAPGASLAKHIHRTAYFFIVASGGLIRSADPDNPTDAHDIQFADDQVTCVPVGADGHVDNRLTNSGTKHHRNDVIELKQTYRG